MLPIKINLRRAMRELIRDRTLSRLDRFAWTATQSRHHFRVNTTYPFSSPRFSQNEVESILVI